MGLLPDFGYPQTGDMADSGFYTCMNCPHDSEDDKGVVYLESKKRLPECPVCGCTYWMKV